MLADLPSVVYVWAHKFDQPSVLELVQTFARMPYLNRLDLAITSMDRIWAETFWALLTNLSLLRELRIETLDRKTRMPETPVNWMASGLDSQARGLRNLRHLVLFDAMVPTTDGTHLRRLAPRLEDLELVLTGPLDALGKDPDFLVSAPDSLRRLSLEGYSKMGLKNFRSLRELSVGRGFGIAAVTEQLSASRIEILTIRSHAAFGNHDLPALLRDGPFRMASLRQLKLDFITFDSVNLGTTQLAGALQAVTTTAQAVLTKSHFLTHWPSGTTASGLQRVLELAESCGVVVTGSALECLKWDRRVNAEMDPVIAQLIAFEIANTVDPVRTLLGHLIGEQDVNSLVDRILGDVNALIATAGRRSLEA